jgi:hypothetical protein
MAKRRRTPEIKELTTVAALATAAGVHASTVGRWRVDPNWAWGDGPWPMTVVTEILAWREQESATKALDSAEGRRLRLAHQRVILEVAKARAELEVLNLAKMKGELLPRVAVEQLIGLLSRGIGKIHGRLLARFPAPGMDEFLRGQIEGVSAQLRPEADKIGLEVQSPVAYAAGRATPPDSPPSPPTPETPTPAMPERK